jgi:hypothetical protein
MKDIFLRTTVPYPLKLNQTGTGIHFYVCADTEETYWWKRRVIWTLKTVSVPFQCSGSDYSDPHNFWSLPRTGLVFICADLNPDPSINNAKKKIFNPSCGFLITYLCRPMHSNCTHKKLIWFLRPSEVIKSLVLLSPDRMGPLGKPPASLALLPSTASSRMRSNPAFLAPHADMKQYECGHTQPLLWTRQCQQKLAVENWRVKTKINNNYDKHKTQLLIPNNHP